jgi:membrane protein YdbS with pleckstrin-like domain
MADSTEEKGKSTTTLVIETVASLMTAAFGLLAALAWNEAIRALVQQYIGAGNQTLGLFIYAIIVTVIAVVATIYIGKVLARYKAMDLKLKKK